VAAQLLLVLRWLRRRIDAHTLARDAGISDATAYCYLQGRGKSGPPPTGVA